MQYSQAIFNRQRSTQHLVMPDAGQYEEAFTISSINNVLHQVLGSMKSIRHPTAKVIDTFRIMHDTTYMVIWRCSGVCACPLLLSVHLLVL